MWILNRFRGNKKDQTGDAVQWSKKSLELWQNGSLDLALLSINRSLDLKLSGGGLVLKGMILNAQANYNDAIQIWDQVQKMDHRLTFLNESKEKALFWRERGFSLLETERYEEALECLNKAIELDNSDENALISKGKTLKNLSEYTECIDCIGKMLAVNPLSVGAWEVKADALLELNNYEEAVNCYDKAIRIEPRRPVSLLNKGRSLGLLGKYEESLECFNKIIEFAIEEKKPLIPRIWFMKGYALYELGRYEEAIQAFDEGLEMKSPIDENLDSKAECLIAKGDALVKLERHSDALKCFNVAIELSPSNPVAWFKKMAPLMKLHHYNEALEAANKANHLGFGSDTGEKLDTIIELIEILKENNPE